MPWRNNLIAKGKCYNVIPHPLNGKNYNVKTHTLNDKYYNVIIPPLNFAGKKYGVIVDF